MSWIYQYLPAIPYFSSAGAQYGPGRNAPGDVQKIRGMMKNEPTMIVAVTQEELNTVIKSLKKVTVPDRPLHYPPTTGVLGELTSMFNGKTVSKEIEA